MLKDILAYKDNFGKVQSNNKKILIEYVSSNPTGPLHVGHGRGAVFGSVLSRLLKEAGFEVDEEYYVNDFGRQMNILSTSLWIRYAQLFDDQIKMIKNGYQGDYLISVAKKLKEIKSDQFYKDKGIVSNLLNSNRELDDETFTDLLIDTIKTELDSNFVYLRNFALDEIIDLIKKDLIDFGVDHNKWFYESSLYQEKEGAESKVDKAINNLKSNKFIYEKDDAIWFKSSDFGDDKDRVLRRSNGEYTYFASDVAYHLDKYDRGYDRVINIWGSDHHGYLPRVRAAMEASKRNIEKLEVVFIQFANLIRQGKKVTMSTRSGEFITLKELVEEVTSEAARFFYINRKADQHLDFDLDLAKEQSKDNPLYYIQYAHARISSALRKAVEVFTDSRIDDKSLCDAEFAHLRTREEQRLISVVAQFPRIVESAALAREPHRVAFYLSDLAGAIHGLWAAGNVDPAQRIVIDDDLPLTQARLALIRAAQITLATGLRLLGVVPVQELRRNEQELF